MADQVIVPNGTIVEETRYTTRTMQRWMNGVTDAVNAPVAPPVTSGFRRLDRRVLAADAATVSFLAINQTFDDLILTVYGRNSNAAGTSIACRLMINSDAVPANYQASMFLAGTSGAGASASSEASTVLGVVTGAIPGTSGSANAIGQIEVLLHNYAQTTLGYKPWMATNGTAYAAGPTMQTVIRTGFWRSTVPITRIDLGVDSGAYLTGCIFCLYGRGGA